MNGYPAHAKPKALHERPRALHAAPPTPWTLHAAGRPRRLWRFPIALSVALIVVLAVGGAAYGYFAASGSGTGTASAEIQPVSVLPATGTPSNDLYPGGTANLRVTIDNTNGFAVTIVAIAQDTTTALGVTGGNGCTKTNAEVSVPTNTSPTGTPTLVLAGHTTKSLTIVTGATMGTTSATGCQTASFHIPLTVTVRS